MDSLGNIAAFWQVALVLAAYVGLLCALAFLVRPVRLRLVEIAHDMLDDDHWTDSERRDILMLIRTSFSFRVGLALPLAIMAFMLEEIIGTAQHSDPEYERLDSDDRFDSVVWRYFVSILAANPLAAAITIPLGLLSFIISAAKDSARGGKEAIELPLLRASSTVQLA